MFCKQCGFENKETAKFCCNCGEKLEAAPESTGTPFSSQTENTAAGGSQASFDSVQGSNGAPAFTPPPADNNSFGTSAPNQPVPGRGYAIASLVCAIAAFVCCTGIITGVLAVVFGIVAKKKGYTGAMATAGIVIGVIGVVFALVGSIIASLSFAVLETNYHNYSDAFPFMMY